MTASRGFEIIELTCVNITGRKNTAQRDTAKRYFVTREHSILGVINLMITRFHIDRILTIGRLMGKKLVAKSVEKKKIENHVESFRQIIIDFFTRK